MGMQVRTRRALVRMSSFPAIQTSILYLCSSGTNTASTRHQEATGRLARAFGCARVVFNDGLRIRQAAHDAGRPYITDAALSPRVTAVKNTPNRAWLGEVSAVVLQQALADLNAAYRNFFASLTGERRAARLGRPGSGPARTSGRLSGSPPTPRFKVLPSGRLRLPKIGDVAVRWSRTLPSEPSSVTVIMDAAGRYFASFVVETDPAADPQRFPEAGPRSASTWG